MPIAFLLALQASGIVVDWLGKRDQIQMSRMGERLEQEGINAQIQTTRLQTEQDSLQAMIKLRQNIGTQAAMFAARGTASGQGTAVLFGNESARNFNADERMRRINQMGNEASLKAKSTLSKFHEKTYEAGVWNDFAKSSLNTISSSPDAWGKIFSAAKATKSKSSGYGLTKLGA